MTKYSFWRRCEQFRFYEISDGSSQQGTLACHQPIVTQSRQLSCFFCDPRKISGPCPFAIGLGADVNACRAYCFVGRCKRSRHASQIGADLEKMWGLLATLLDVQYQPVIEKSSCHHRLEVRRDLILEHNAIMIALDKPFV